jgi:pectin methylesterase-like acyl-CoA thioesterase
VSTQPLGSETAEDLSRDPQQKLDHATTLGLSRRVPQASHSSCGYAPRRFTALLALCVAVCATEASGRDYFVNPSGAGGAFPTVQGAVDAVTGQTETDRANIFIAPGQYVQRVSVNKPFVTFIGQGDVPTDVVISFNGTVQPGNYNATVSIFPGATAFMARNLTFRNSTPSSSTTQALAVESEADRAVFDNVWFLGYQDTLFVSNQSRQYFRRSWISGDVDFIFGNATAVFDACTIESKGGGYITAADTLRTTANGMIFLDCALMTGFGRAPDNSVYLGRPWLHDPAQENSSVIYIRARMGPHITQAGWHPWDGLVLSPGTNRDPYTRYSEWGSTDLAGQLLADSDGNGTPNGRVSWADPMTAAQAANYTLENIFGPVEFWNATTQPETAGPYASQGEPWHPDRQVLGISERPGATSQFFNISTRLRIEPNQRVGIAGFIVTGNAPKKVIVRAIGPSLTAVGLDNALADPVLTLHGEDSQTIASNNNWRDDAASAAELEKSGLAPTHELESALVVTLPPGHYTAVLDGKPGAAGTALVELYDGDLPAESEFANISTLGFAGTGNDVLIAGFVVGGPAFGNVVVRALGPSLTQFGVTNAIEDPTLQLFDGNGSLTSNDDWGTTGDSIPVLLRPSHAKESAVHVSLPPGHYTAIVQGKGAATGVALVEAYSLE